MADFDSYCAFCATRPANDVDRAYHDTRYGFPIEDDTELFALLVLEINQAGLSWRTILNKETNFRKAYDGFDIPTVAAYGDADRTRLLNDAGIIRNRLKVDAAIHNANAVLALQREHGSFKAWLDAHHPLEKTDWVKLFKTRFKFVGGEIVGEFLMSSGYLKGAHTTSCPIHDAVLQTGPAWVRTTGR
ncbi:methyladenine glycosylase [Pseudodesulfovibrio mercurii]|uniref:Methyladenine glycosylase n=1 Tax=Pseudodesulfovibrio mercurii TaxID=641491 RepID=F0JIF2_9BACT|nr:DNA-3-methyladenine glycosylase I [Pseudodesulfovibrio mercurii]EGB14204.1 methyladenine glycosylase [Pseudodesulfovibrio mercurii]